MTDLYVIAGEPSADKLGAPIIQALRERSPCLQIAGIAGPKLREIGVIGPTRMEDLQMMGFVDVAMALPRLIKIFTHTRNEILRLNPKGVLCIDYPGFNLRLERSLRKRDYRGKLIHVVCPTVWAWRKWRIPMMVKNLDLLLTLFPFEKECFANTPLPVEYIGHPLVSKVLTHLPIPDFHKRYGLDPKQPILALFPGSRKGVIERNLPLQLTAAKLLQSRHPNLAIAISLSDPARQGQIRSFAPTLPLIEPLHIYDLMRSAHLAIATSGTITLELALFGTPAVVNYALRPFDRFLAQKIFRLNLPHYCIVNILAKRRVYPELMGPDLSLSALAEQAERLWTNRNVCVHGCEEVRAILGKADAGATAAEKILDCLQ